MKRIPFSPISAVLLGLLLTTAACKKDEVTPTPTNADTPAFVGPRWQMTAFILDPSIDFDGDGKVDSDLLPFMDACDRDNSLVFDKGGKIKTSEGQLLCNKPSSTTKDDSWTYDAGTKSISIVDGEDPGSVSTWEVVDVSAKTLTIKTTVVEQGHTFKATLNWKAI